ncbi:hypothetical protein [Chlamydiifrater volucris]|uniref:hypothetical protein n=1 Tax=Chlamydiifrater volucris TaxID=2681470 RepID=UPI001BCADDE3|nr:hypothetical protein [Chlamydiifrater volucris]
MENCRSSFGSRGGAQEVFAENSFGNEALLQIESSRVSRVALVFGAVLGSLVFLFFFLTNILSGSVVLGNISLLLGCSLALSLVFTAAFVMARNVFTRTFPSKKEVVEKEPELEVEKKKEKPLEVRPVTVPKDIGVRKIPSLERVGCLYVKESVWETLSNEEKSRLSSPLSVIQEISSKKIAWPSVIHEEIVGQLSDNQRCGRELSFILMGYFSMDEISEISEFCQEERGYIDPSEASSSDLLYAKCIKRWPRLVAVEATWICWLRSSFSYLGDAKEAIFKNKGEYKNFFFRWLKIAASPFKVNTVRVVASILEKFSGAVPASLSVFCLDEINLRALKAYMEENNCDNWDFFCRKVSEFCDQAVRYDPIFGSMFGFVSYLSQGKEEYFLQKQEPLFSYEKSDTNFFISPESLWDMQSMCNKDPELLAKIEEGLSYLYQSGYLGNESPEEVRSFEKVVLGLDESK